MTGFYTFIASLLVAIGITGDLPYATVQRGMEANDAHAIIGLAKDKIVLQVPGAEGAYPLAQAEMILQSFFQKNPKGSFLIRYKNNQSGNVNGVIVGSYQTKNYSYRSTFQFRNAKYEQTLESVSIIKE